MRGIELPIFYMNDATMKAEELDITMPLSEYDVRMMRFYHINCISEYLDEFDNDHPYSRVFANGDTFTCALSYKELENKIESHED